MVMAEVHKMVECCSFLWICLVVVLLALLVVFFQCIFLFLVQLMANQFVVDLMGGMTYSLLFGFGGTVACWLLLLLALANSKCVSLCCSVVWCLLRCQGVLK